MKKKVVIRLPMNDQKSRSRALKTVVSVTKQLESAALTGAEKNLVEVVGEGIDAAALTMALRKKVACADLVSVTDDKKPEVAKPKVENAGNKPKVDNPVPTAGGWHNNYPILVGVTEPIYDPACCTIM